MHDDSKMPGPTAVSEGPGVSYLGQIRGSIMKETMYTVGRNPIEIQTENQKNTLKILSEILISNPKMIWGPIQYSSNIRIP